MRPRIPLNESLFPETPLPGRRAARYRAGDGADDVRLLVPGDDLVHGAQAGHAVAIHQGSGRGQPAAGAVRLRDHDRLHHAGLRRHRGADAAPVGTAHDAWWPGGAARGVLDLVPERVAVGFDGLLLLRPDPRHPRDQPVLDAGQRGVRPAPGQAPVRVHRRRRQPGRHRRQLPVAAGHGHRHDQPAAGQRGADDRVPDPGGRHHQARKADHQRVAHRR